MTTTHTAGRSLDQSLVTGIAWTGIVKWGVQVLSWVATLATVRLLAPSDYGLFGMAMVYVGLGQIVTEAGISAAVIQKPDLSERETAELCGLAIIVGAVFAMATVAIAGPLSLFFSQPSVRGILMPLSAVFLLRGIQLVPRAQLARELRFRVIALVEFVETVSLVLTTLALALWGWGYWSLVAGSLVSAVATVPVIARHRFVWPALPTNAIRAPVRVTLDVTVSQISWYAYTNADFAIVGRMMGSMALGAYSFAWNIANIVGERVSAVIGRVTPPLFAAVQGDPVALRRYFSLAVEGIALMTLPASVGLSLVADEFVPVVAGNQWAAAVVPLQILAIYAAFRSISYIAPQVLIATGRTRSNMRFGLLATLVLPPAFIIAAQWGAAGVAAAWVIVYPALALLTYVRATLAAAQMSWGAYWAALWPAVRATLVMACAVVVVRAATPASMPMKLALLLHVMTGAVVYSALVGFALRTRLRPLVTMLRESVWGVPVNKKPVFAVGERSGRHRLLLISYHFPPSSEVGALRWQKLVQLGAERGWEFDVIALEPAELASVEPARNAELPAGTRVYGVASRPHWLLPLTRGASQVVAALRPRARELGAPRSRPGSIRSDSVRWLPREPRDILRNYFAWLDVATEARWAKDAARVALSIHEPDVHRAVITCGPPHEPHLAGVAVAEATGLPLVVDFRDPWSLVQRLPEAIASRAWLSLAAAHERRAVRAASLVVANTAPFRSAMAGVYPTLANRMIVVMNGCDEETVPSEAPTQKFVLAYAGSIYLDRDPRPLFRAAGRVARDLGLTPAEFSIEFIGDVAAYNDVPLDQIAREEGASAFLTLHAHRPRAEALAFLARASMLVLLPQDSHLAIPAKLFDYVRYSAWLIAITGESSATAQALRGSGAYVFGPADIEGIAATIRDRYVAFCAGDRATPLATDGSFARRTQADRLFTAIERVTGAPQAPVAEEALCAVS